MLDTIEFIAARDRFERMTPLQKKGVSIRLALSNIRDDRRAFIRAVADERARKPLTVH
jgi:hypothetical protein